MRRLLLAVVLAAALLTAACGGSSNSSGVASLENGDAGQAGTSPTTAADSEQAMLDFAACMREHGIDMPDPTMDENGSLRLQLRDQILGQLGAQTQGAGGSGSSLGSLDMEAVNAARDACAQYLEGVVQQFSRADRTGLEDKALEYAACLREQGLDAPDPVFTGAQGELFGLLGQLNSLAEDPDFEAADQACIGIFGGGGSAPAGSGGGGGGS